MTKVITVPGGKNVGKAIMETFNLFKQINILTIDVVKHRRKRGCTCTVTYVPVH